MKTFFSCIPYSDGICGAYNYIYKNVPSSSVYIVSDGDDTERAIFFKHIIKKLRHYSTIKFVPFYDEVPDGLYIEELNTYILSDGGYNKISPIIPGVTEKYISISKSKNYTDNMRAEIFSAKKSEYSFYKNAIVNLNAAAKIKSKMHSYVSMYTDDKKIVNSIKRIVSKNLKYSESNHSADIRLLSSLTPLGFKTQYDTIFKNIGNVIDIQDSTGFIGTIMINVIKLFAIKNNQNIIISPTYYENDLPQFLILPNLNLSITLSDDNHILPFTPTERINVSRFILYNQGYSKEKILALRNEENALLDKSVLSIYKGRDIRYALNYNIRNYTDIPYTKSCADKFLKTILK